MDHKLLDYGIDSWYELGLEAKANGIMEQWKAAFKQHLRVSNHFLKKELDGYIMKLKGEIDEYHLLHRKRALKPQHSLNLGHRTK